MQNTAVLYQRVWAHHYVTHYETAKINFITSWAIDVIRSSYYIPGPCCDEINFWGFICVIQWWVLGRVRVRVRVYGWRKTWNPVHIYNRRSHRHECQYGYESPGNLMIRVEFARVGFLVNPYSCIWFLCNTTPRRTFAWAGTNLSFATGLHVF